MSEALCRRADVHNLRLAARTVERLSVGDPTRQVCNRALALARMGWLRLIVAFPIRGSCSEEHQRRKDPHCDQNKPNHQAYPWMKAYRIELFAERSVSHPSIREV